MKSYLLLFASLWARKAFIYIVIDAGFAENLLTPIELDWIYDEVLAYKECDLLKHYDTNILCMGQISIYSWVQTSISFLLI
jgi:hypothetical protein